METTMIDFDSLNIASFGAGKWQRKPIQDPYRSGSDFRLKVRMQSLLHVAFVFQWTDPSEIGGRTGKEYQSEQI